MQAATKKRGLELQWQMLIGFLVGQMMKKSKGSANPKLAQELLRERLSG